MLRMAKNMAIPIISFCDRFERNQSMVAIERIGIKIPPGILNVESSFSLPALSFIVDRATPRYTINTDDEERIASALNSPTIAKIHPNEENVITAM